MPRLRTFAVTVITFIVFGVLFVTQVQQPGDTSTSSRVAPTAPAFYDVPDPTTVSSRTARPTLIPTITALPEVTASVPPTVELTPEVDQTLVSTDEQRLVNGVPLETFIIIPDDVKDHVRKLFLRGWRLGRSPRAFSKLGDSTIENPQFMTRFDDTRFTYDLAEYAYLAPVIDYYAGSFERQGAAVRRGLHTWSVFDPMWATDPSCRSGETMLECEFRVWNPSILFVRMGSNDAGIPDQVDQNLRRIVEFSLENGVIPIMGTKADRFEGSNINNQIIRQIAADYRVPLWDFDLIAGTIPGRGLGSDRVHMTYFFEHDYTDPRAYRTGNGIHTLTGLMMLEAIWLEVRDLIPKTSKPLYGETRYR